MGRHAKAVAIIENAREVLQQHAPMTVRQVYYQLVSRQIIENNKSSYQAVSRALVSARQEGEIEWHWIEDRLRRPRHVNMWDDLNGYGRDIKAWYKRDVWANQPAYFEFWLEKDALSGIFEDELEEYGVTLNVGRGYDGWSSLHNAAARYQGRGSVEIVYWGDFDPSGEDMVRSLRDRLIWFGADISIHKAALTADDISTYELPPDLTKVSDTRREKFVAKHGDVSVEIDALPVDVLRQRIVDEVQARMDLMALEEIKVQQEAERKELLAAISAISDVCKDPDITE